jgi:DNA processing protein
MEQLRYLLALHRSPGMGAALLTNLLKNTSELASLFNNKGELLLKNKRSVGPTDWAGVERDLKWLGDPNCHLITPFDSEYPALLRQISNAPAVLFVQGNIRRLANPQIAIVGSRNSTVTGRDNAFKFAQHFSELGFTVTSGLALGIDAAAHQGALKGQGGTIAVLGTGIDKIYPSSHVALAHEIIEKGVLLSEYPIGVPPAPSNFPRRNRIISGLSLGTLVVEAALKSGSLITARYALDQGREVFAIPGSIHSPLAKGCHHLIRQGAKLVETAEDVLEELSALINYVGMPPKTGESGR